MVLQDMRRLYQLQSQLPDLPSIKSKHINPIGTKKPVILTPTHSLSVIGTTLGAVILVLYIITAIYAVITADELIPAYIVGTASLCGFVLIYLLSKLSFTTQAIILAAGIASNIVNLTYPFVEIELSHYALMYLMLALMFALGLYRIYRIKRGIWDRRIGGTRIHGFYSDGVIGMLNKNKEDKDLIYKHKAEENTHDILISMEGKGQFYAFNDLPTPYNPANYVDVVLISGKNLVIVRSLMLGNGEHEVKAFTSDNNDADSLNLPDKNYAFHVKDHYKQLYPHLTVSFWFIVHPSEKPSGGLKMSIKNPHPYKGIHMITPQDIPLLEKVLYKSSFPILFTRRSDIIRLNSMRQRAVFTTMQKTEDNRFLQKF